MRISERAKPDIRALTRLVPPEGNLVQGQNENPVHPDLMRSLDGVMQEGLNHYSVIEGVDELRVALARKIKTQSGIDIDPHTRPLELMITPGATGALVAIAHTYLRGASSIVFEPYYPYHRRTLESAGASVQVVRLRGEALELDVDELRKTCCRASISTNTALKAIIICSPANPTGRIFSRQELTEIINCAVEHDLLLIADEVYSDFTLDAGDHISTASIPGAFDRTITVNSFSKSWAVSGWRLGYAFGPGRLVDPLSVIANVFYVCPPTPLQHALARVLMAHPDYQESVRREFGGKRERMASALTETGFQLYDSRSSFYLWARVPERFPDATALNHFLLEEAGIAGVPGSAFADSQEFDGFMRLCIARTDAMLDDVVQRMKGALG